MAHGDFIDEKRGHRMGLFSKSYKALDAAGATGNGKWIDVSLFPRGSIQVFGTFVGTVKIMASNEENPVDATDGPQLGADITAPSIVAYDLPCRWIKVKPTAYTSGAINANLHCLSR